MHLSFIIIQWWTQDFDKEAVRDLYIMPTLFNINAVNCNSLFKINRFQKAVDLLHVNVEPSIQ